jgi:glycosyltransferase involved in cell wall biosynthesis
LIHSKKTSCDLYKKTDEIVAGASGFLPREIGSFAREFIRVGILRQQGFDVIHELSDFATGTPFLFNLNSKKVITIQDLSGFLFPDKFHGLGTYYYRFILPKVLKKVDYILVSSNQTRNDIVYRFDISDDKIRTLYLGVDHNLFKPRDKERVYDFPYILHVGTEHPLKNLKVAFEAFSRVKKKHKDLKFVKVGGANPEYREITLRHVKKLGLQEDVIFAGYVPETSLPGIYSQAQLLIFPSLYEGFGLPVVESMACGTPVVASNAGSLPEVVSDAGITVDPYDTDGFSDAIERVLTDDALRKKMIKKGLTWAKRFTWEKTAEETLKLYEETAE